MASTTRKLWESYSSCRLLWFSHDDDVNVPDLLPTEDPRSSFVNLRRLRQAKSNENFNESPQWIGAESIARASWHKDTAQPAGVFSVGLYQTQDWSRSIQAGDVFFVYMRGDKLDAEYLVSIVSVDHVSLVTDAENGADVEMCDIQCRDLGKILLETPTVFDPKFPQLDEAEFFSAFWKNVGGSGAVQLLGPPSRIIQLLLKTYFEVGKSVQHTTGDTTPSRLRQWTFPGSNVSMLSLLDISTFMQQPMVGALIMEAAILQSAGNLWALCDMYANRVVNEFFIDVRDIVPGATDSHRRSAIMATRVLASNGISSNVTRGFYEEHKLNDLSLVPEMANEGTAPNRLRDRYAPRYETTDRRKRLPNTPESVVALVHRQLPYDTISFYTLPASEVSATEVSGAVSIGRGQQDVFNLFRVTLPTIFKNDSTVLQFGLLINRGSIQQHGVRRFQAESVFPFAGVRYNVFGELFRGRVGKGLVQTAFDYYRSLVSTWHAHNDKLWSGNISTRLRPDIRVGTRLTYRTEDRAGTPRVFDFYVQTVNHTFTPDAGGSSTAISVVRGIERTRSGVESQLYWTDKGSQLPVNPYEEVLPDTSGLRVHIERKSDTPDEQPAATGGVEPGEAEVVTE